MKMLAFVTSTEDPNLTRDDRLAVEPLAVLGYSVRPLVWDEPNKNLNQFDAFIFRSCWNYHVKFEQFLVWIENLERLHKPILNPMSTNRWNLNKVYLLELKAMGAPVPEMEWVGKGKSFDSHEVRSKLVSLRSDQIVIRPAVSMSGYDTYLVSAADSRKVGEIWRSMPRDRDILIQEFIPEIYTSGETSLIFFNGKFSHAVRKLPKAGEFRIHSEYGGTRAAIVPAPELISQAAKILNLVGEPLLFARVDVVERLTGPVLIELEIIDPSLYLDLSEGAAGGFAKAIDEKLRNWPR